MPRHRIKLQCVFLPSFCHGIVEVTELFCESEAALHVLWRQKINGNLRIVCQIADLMSTACKNEDYVSFFLVASPVADNVLET